MSQKRVQYMADFETTTTPGDVRVWAGCLVNIDTGKVEYICNNIDDFMNHLVDKNTVVYFHNLRFDGEYILHWLLTHDYKYSEVRTNKTFDTIISKEGQFYKITVIFAKKGKQYKKVEFYDSLKKLPFKVATIAKAFNLPMAKGEIDYHAPRPVGHVLTQEEQEYLEDDCKIVAAALKTQFEQGLTRMTIGADALSSFKKIIGRDKFDRLFPELPYKLDKDIRQAYKGGFTYLNPKYKNVLLDCGGLVFDVNSLYPDVMYHKPMPYGYPMYFEGEYKQDPVYPLYITRFWCTFKLKPGHIPTVQLKKNLSFKPTEYLTTSRTKQGDLPVCMTMTNVDYELFREHYDVRDPVFECGWKFKQIEGIFRPYIDYWMHIKETSTGALRTLAKLMLNNLYGKFATNPEGGKKVPYLDKKTNTVKYERVTDELRDSVYTAVGAFITAWARDKTIRAAQAHYDRWIYCDTDSLHMTGTELPEDLDIHPTRLGAWAHEGTWTVAKFLRAKTYMETMEGETEPHVTCAGMPDNVKELVTYDNFKPGASFHGKLLPKRYPGGVVLEPTDFTIL